MAVRRRVKAGNQVLPVPDAVGVQDDSGRVVGWDLRATHAFLAELGGSSDCDAVCAAAGHVVPLSRSGVFRHAILAVDHGEHDDAAAERWLAANPAPMIVFDGVAGHYEPRAGWSVVDVVRAMVAEGVVA